MTSLASAAPYPARLRIDYPERLDRLTTLLRILFTGRYPPFSLD